jgi:hypothetical protein
MIDQLIALYKNEGDPSYDALNISLLVLSALNLIVFSACFALVLVKTRGNVYYRMGFIYVSYLICQVFRLLMDSTRIFVKDVKLE